MKIIIKGLPLSINQTYRTCRASRSMFLSQKAKSYMDAARWQIRSQYRGKPTDKDLEVSFYYYFGDKRVHDHLNYNKALSDCFNQLVWQDDRQILISHHYTCFDKNNPRVEVDIKEII